MKLKNVFYTLIVEQFAAVRSNLFGPSSSLLATEYRPAGPARMENSVAIVTFDSVPKGIYYMLSIMVTSLYNISHEYRLRIIKFYTKRENRMRI